MAPYDENKPYNAYRRCSVAFLSVVTRITISIKIHMPRATGKGQKLVIRDPIVVSPSLEIGPHRG